MGQALHAKACSPDRDGIDMVSIESAREAAAASVQLWQQMLKEEHDKAEYAHALLLEANTCTILAGRQRLSLEAAERAEKNALEAVRILQKLKSPDAGSALRVLGIAVRSLYKLDPLYAQGAAVGPQHGPLGEVAKECMMQAIAEFERSGSHESNVWCAVAYWNVYLILSVDGSKHDEALPWLKRSALLHEKITDPEHRFTKLYRKQLAELLERLSFPLQAAAVRDGGEVLITAEEAQSMRACIDATKSKLADRYADKIMS
mmetsp:Transcript_58894/g.116670  ORF Transcript_58894/g.116670 Transcript_58894/m.116670 type:complete len:261 (+) Transcript_58894:1-783(+)